MRANSEIVIAAAFSMLVISAFASTGFANEVEIVDVQVDCSEGLCNFEVTARHDDEGWDHYADEWNIRLPNGKVTGSRVLMHPHVDEQPFKRSLSSVRIPDSVREVDVCGHDTVHGWSTNCKRVRLPGFTADSSEDTQDGLPETTNDPKEALASQTTEEATVN